MRRTTLGWLALIILLAGIFYFGHLVYGSKLGQVDRKIVSEIEKRCVQGRPCTIRLVDVVDDFDWDTLYVFEMGMGRRDIESVIHTSLNHDPDLVKTLIFMKQGQITHYEEERENVEGPTNQDLNFDIDKSSGYKQFSRNVRLSISIEKFDNGVVYGMTVVP